MNHTVGKVIADTVYVHALSLEHLDTPSSDLVREALSICPDAVASANVFKVDSKNRGVSLLNYPDFFDQPFPELSESWRVHVDLKRITYRTYDQSINPPILHRKELLLSPDHPRRCEYENLTAQAEQIGLFSDVTTIGFRRSWEARIRQAGYCIVGHHLQPVGNDLSGISEDEDTDAGIQRHRTALSRSGLSAPIQALARHGLLATQFDYFDYGCGRGDDLRALGDNGLVASGWDPHFAPQEPKLAADVVNLGFVVNVIEDFDERINALRDAFSLARQLLVVSTMLYGGAPPPGRPFRDGFLTQRNTFQKYFTQAELKEFVETVLDTEAVPVAPGIMFVFSDKEIEQRFLYRKQRSGYTLRLLDHRRERIARQPRPPRETRAQQLISVHGDLVTSLWNCILTLGRLPHETEFPQTQECIEAFGTWNRALRFTTSVKPLAELVLASQQRKADLTVYLALQLFSRRKAYRQLEIGLQRDIKTHFGDHQRALAVARQHLLDAAKSELLDDACQVASTQGLGYYSPSDYLQLHVSLIERLPALLRIYVGCGAMLFGDLDGVALVKIHIRSGKLTLMKFDDFMGSPLPRMVERIKIKLREQDVDFFLYSPPHEPPLLYFKSRYVDEDASMYEKQVAFDEQLESLELFDPASYGFTEAELTRVLAHRRLEVLDFSLVRSRIIPNLDDACGQHFAYRDLIECGETWERARIPNVPKQPDTYNSLLMLASKVLDPVIEYFGMLKLTYGFASTTLTKEIHGRIAPHLDQHAGHELNRLGKPVCGRLGAAVDFIVEDEDMLEVAKWITENVPFDRLYVYGPSRPIHISYGPEDSRLVYEMVQTRRGQLIPRPAKFGVRKVAV